MHRSILYAGYQNDAETGIYYLNARMYDPVIARFLQEDTYRGDTKDPLSLNLYAYCKSNPMIYYDPSGHKSMFLTGLADAYITYDAAKSLLYAAVAVRFEIPMSYIQRLAASSISYLIMNTMILPQYC